MTESCPTVILRLQDWLSGRVLAIITKILMQIPYRRTTIYNL